ncbi:MAG: excinuclease ABC subunit C [Flavobacteriaceae bacterium]|nr:MAG: excinuclease ABC subunit C [Flavobacteriaceae bacterium]
MENPNELSLSLKSLAQNPGVYQFFDKNGEILYVGKAKNLKKRVSSYFAKEQLGKTKALVSKIVSLKTIVVETEFDALLLENNLIKTLQPRYNIQLKDDKTYPFICIKNERFPRIFLTRKTPRDGSKYFGPYANVKMAKGLLELIGEIYPLRNCNFDLSEKNIQNAKYKCCLEYHLKNCLGPCENLQNLEDYNQNVEAISGLLKGNYSQSLEILQEKMLRFSSNLQFEQAQSLKEKIELLKTHKAKSTIVNPSISNVDVLTLVFDDDLIYYNYLVVANGSVVQSYSSELKNKIEEPKEEILLSVLVEMRNKFNSTSSEIFLPFEVDYKIPGLALVCPKIGDKKALVDFSIRNAKFYRQDQLKQIKIVDPDRHTNRIMAEMKTLLHLSAEPRHIEGFDNSNLQGTNPVGACVVFKDGKPSKNEYRIFNIKTVEGPNDFASMEEVIYRRYKRMLEENSPLPELIVIDGGKGQLSSAVKSLEALGLRGKIAILGIAKRLEEIYFPDDPIPLYLDKKSETLKVIQHIRNESHRYGISKHRAKRSKDSLKSELDHLSGIGPVSKKKLLDKFKSIKGIRNASEKELADVLGQSKAKALHLLLQEKNKN